MEDGDVILIAPPADNEDGSQTFYILDPCPSSEDPDEAPGIELINLTAEVKNTGAIAVVSTNSDTGALEITLTKKGDKIKIEEMDGSKDSAGREELIHPTMDVDSELPQNYSGEGFIPKHEEETIDEKMNTQDINIDVESGEPCPPSEADPLNFEVVEQVQHIDNEQEDEVEEGRLYIDDNKNCDIQDVNEENLGDSNKETVSLETNDHFINESHGREKICEKEGVVNDNTCIDNYCVRRPSKEAREAVLLVQNTTKHSDNKRGYLNNIDSQLQSGSEKGDLDVSGTYEAVIHGHLMKIPTTVERTSVCRSINESVDSTNTALTLLELAGGPSYRSSVEQRLLEIEQIQGEKQDSQPSVIQLTNVECQPAPELTILQPVPLEPSVEENPTCNKELPLESSVEENTSCHELVTSEANKANQLQTSNARTPVQKFSSPKVSTELVQRLLVNEDASNRAQYKHLPRSSVTKSEIAQEIYERSRQKYPYSEENGKDVFFALKIAHRLASKIVTPDKPIDSTDKTTTEMQSLHSHSTSSMYKDPIPKCMEDIKSATLKKDAISDNIELLKILEDDPEDLPNPDSNQAVISTDKKPKIKITRPRVPLLKLHPEIERELALKQLEDFSSSKKKVDFTPDIFKMIDVPGKSRQNKNHEHNNNSQSKVVKRKINYSPSGVPKRIKNEVVDSKAATVHPSQITETLKVEGQDYVEEHSKDCKSLKQYSNKRLSRNPETPPRDVPMEVLLNGIDDNLGVTDDNKSVSKNKIFKATNTRKRQEELKKKHFANIMQRVKPQKKRGRPPKKKPLQTDDMLNREFLMNIINEQSKPTDNLEKNDPKHVQDTSKSLKEQKPFKTKKMREIEQLLGDEGAINMLYSVEQKRQSGSELKRGVLPSYRRKKKDLILKTKLVKSAVLRLSNSPSPATGRVSLRGQGLKDGEEDKQTEESSLRRMSVDSHDSHQYLSSPPPDTFSFPAKTVAAEASRIIRRRSSSSNYSSRSNSPRRLSVDGERINVDSPDDNQSQGLKDTSPHFVTSSTTPPCQQTNGNNPSKKREKEELGFNEKVSIKEIFQQPKMSIEYKKAVAKYQPNTKLKSVVPLDCALRRPGRPKKNQTLEDANKRKELDTSLAAAINEFTKESKKENKNIPVKTVRMGCKDRPSKVAVYSKSAPGSGRKKLKANVYRELALKHHDKLVEITLEPVSCSITNALNIDVMRELIAVFAGLIKDDNCRVVLFNSAGDLFCQGVDFPALVQPNSDMRQTVAHDMALAVKELTKTLATFPKPIVAAVQGPAVGLGTTLLPLCDLVLASSKATFHTPYARLSQVPEGAATLTLPTLLGYTAANELLFVGRKLSAVEAQQLGLVTRILQTETFRQEVMSIATTVASQSRQAMSATKALLRHSLLTGLETTLVSETHLLTQHWTSDECQSIFSRYLEGQGGDLAFIFSSQSA